MNSSGYPNNALSAWQLTLMAVVAVGLLTAWLVAVYRADKSQSKAGAAASSAARTAEKAPERHAEGQRAA